MGRIEVSEILSQPELQAWWYVPVPEAIAWRSYAFPQTPAPLTYCSKNLAGL
jgi:hypothetical protein